MNNIINYGNHNISKDDILAVSKALRQNKITQGKNIELFEKKLNSFFGSKHALVVSSGTAALHLAMLSLNLSRKDKVVTSPISFLASANCVEYVGAKVDFCDIDTSQLIEHSTMWWRGANAIRLPGPEQTTMSWLGGGRWTRRLAAEGL